MGTLAEFNAADGKYEAVACCLCGEKPEPYAVDYNGNRLAVCPRCDFRFVSPRPLSSAMVENVYDDKYYTEDRPGAKTDENYQYYLGCIERQRPSKGLLFDVGVGSGAMLKTAARSGWSIEGLDVQPAQVEYLRKKLSCKVHLGLLENLEGAEARYDAVTLIHVLEHTLNPVEFLNKCAAVLKPGGLLYAVFPNTASLSDRLKDALSASGLKSKPYKHLAADHHLWFFTPAVVRELVRKTEFSALSVKTIYSRQKMKPLNSPFLDLMARLGQGSWIELILQRP